MILGSEQGSVQNPFVRYAQEAGWQYLSKEEVENLRRGGFMSPLLDALAIEQVQRLNPGIVDAERAEEIIKQLRRVHPSIKGNEDAWEFLKGLKTVFIEEEKRERNVCLLEPDDIDANAFHVVEEFTFHNGINKVCRFDIVFFINGIPVIMVETKRAREREGIAKAFDDIRYYHEQAPEFVAISQLHALTHLIQFYYGATWSLTRKTLFNWRDESVQESDFETLCKTFIAPRRVLRVLTDFILFVRKDDVLSKIVLRSHQMRAVDRCIGRAKELSKRRGLIWHTQGSGKTYTMIATAKKLMADPTFENPTVLMLVDRCELEDQLFKNLSRAGVSFKIAASKRHLQKLLKADLRGLIVSMIHKFEDVPELISKRTNIYVLIDEAHRTTGGDLGNYLMGAFPNATYLGFTGTPIDKTAHGRGTFKTFGVDDDKGYLDKYSIRESIHDGTTVPINYALAPNELRVDRDVLDREFLSLAEAEGVSEIEELNKVLEKAVTLRNMLKNRDRVDKVARFIADHFRDTIEPMGYKAFVVTVDREACCLFKEALDRYLPPEYSRVLISSRGKADRPLLQKYHLSDREESAIRRDFKDPEKQPMIVIVTEKLLTGFDAPLLYCMYLDKPMRDHVLLQAIARVNRPYEVDGKRKTAGFVLDFVGIFDKLEKALAFDSQDVSGVIENIEVLEMLFEECMKKGREEYLPIIAGASGDKQVEALLEHFRDKDLREEFYNFFRELQDVYEILSPSAFLRPYIEDYGTLTYMYFTLHSQYDRDIPVDKEFQRKTARLVQEQTESGLIKQPDESRLLDEQVLMKIADEETSDTVKIFNLLKALHDIVKHNAERQPYLISIGEKAEEIARAFEERQKTTQEALEELKELISELEQARKSQGETGLSPESFAVYWYLRREGIENSRAIASDVEQAFISFPHWQVSERQEQEVRRSIYRALIDRGVEKVVEIANSLIRLLKRESR